MNLVRYDDQVLRHSSGEVFNFTGINQVVDQLFTELKKSKAVGIAAPQLGVSLRVIIVDPSGGTDPTEKLVMVNPRITYKSENKEVSREGCLSLPDVQLEIERHSEIEVSFFDLNGTRQTIRLNGFKSFICQHEIDHLNGILILDKVNRHSRRAALAILKKG